MASTRPPGVLILIEDAEQYPEFLQSLIQGGTLIATASSVAEARHGWCGQTIVFGQPDLLAEALPRMQGIQWVQSCWAGVTPLLKFHQAGFVLTGIKNVFGPQIAEYVLGYLLAGELKIAERLERQRQRQWWPEPSGSLWGKTLGILGTGSLGKHLAQVARAFGMRVLGYSRSGQAVDGFHQVYSSGQLQDVLQAADYLVCALPDTPATTHLLDQHTLRQMQPHAILINVGRGNVVVESDLAEALNKGELAGAVLDVFDPEPPAADSPLWHAPGLRITGHIAAISKPEEVAAIFVENYRRFVASQPLNYRIDFTRGY